MVSKHQERYWIFKPATDTFNFRWRNRNLNPILILSQFHVGLTLVIILTQIFVEDIIFAFDTFHIPDIVESQEIG